MKSSRPLSYALQREILLTKAANERSQCCQFLDKLSPQHIKPKAVFPLMWLAKNVLLCWKTLGLFWGQQQASEVNSKHSILKWLKIIAIAGYFGWQIKRLI